MHRSRIAAALLCLALAAGGTSGGANGETIVAAGSVLSDSETALLESNPALAEVAATSPERLREILDKLAEVVAHPSTMRGGLDQLDDETVRLLERNPALLEAWRSSPEASADLLALIRIAAGGGKPQR
jgi:hypothetical protein